MFMQQPYHRFPSYLTPSTTGPRHTPSGAAQAPLLPDRGAGPRASASGAPRIRVQRLPHMPESLLSAAPTPGRLCM